VRRAKVFGRCEATTGLELFPRANFDWQQRPTPSACAEGRSFRSAAKRRSDMNAAKRKAQDNRCLVSTFPPERVRKLLVNLKTCLGWAEGQPLSFEDWSPIVCRPANTLASWCESGEAHQIQALLASLERLPEQVRHQLLDEACRIHPTLQHRRLGHDFLATSRLKEILGKPSGFTFIQGHPAHMRTFLLVALGNSFNQAHPGGKAVSGLDAQPAETLAPVLGVTYVADPLNASRVAKWITEAWLRVRASSARLFLFNGILSHAPEMQNEIAGCARRAHVIVANGVGLNLRDLGKGFPPPVHLISVSPSREVPEWIKVEIAPA
jgi:hypothetical protein